jgi:glycosyltransferase involved in cell wall biosynthesis
MNPFKRHRLAAGIPRLLLVGGIQGRSDRREYFDELRRELTHATFLHATTDEFLPADAIARAVNQARVGLCLSEVEGGMFAATEYLLCGLPVVSTPSRGGRDEWFDAEVATVIDADAERVREAAEAWLARRPSAQRIRARTLDRMWAHRRRFFDLIDRIRTSEGHGGRFEDEWPGVFFNKLVRWRRPYEVMHHLDADVASSPFPHASRSRS